MYRPPTDIVAAENELILLLNKGDKVAFETLYHHYSAAILAKLLLLVKDKEIAKEILQDVFMTIWEKRQFIDAEKSFRSYLFKIAENKVIDVYRKVACNKRMQNHLLRSATDIHHFTEEALELKESSALLQQAVRNLSPQRQKIFILCRVEGKSYHEAGKILGISPGTVNDHMVKALRFIKGHFNMVKFLIVVLFLCDF